MYVSRAIFPILMVHHSLSTNRYKMSIFERSVTCSSFQKLYSHIEKNSGEKLEDMFLVKIASKGTSLRRELIQLVEAACLFCILYQNCWFHFSILNNPCLHRKVNISLCLSKKQEFG